MKSSLSKKIAVASATLLVSAALSLPTYAQTLPAYTTSGAETNLAGYGLSGFEFTPTANIDVTALGFTALSLGGGDAPHVTLWDASAGFGSLTQIYDTGDIIGSVTGYPAAATAATPSYVSVGTPILLTAGTTYLVTAPAYWAATYNAITGGVTPNSDLGTVSFLKGGGWNGWANSGYNFSTLTTALPAVSPGVANLQFSVVEVPEPSTYALMGAGLLTLLVTLRRRSAQFGL